MIPVALPVKLFTDARGLSLEWCCTYEISVRTARLRLTPGVKTVGQEIWLQRNNRRAKFRVTSISDPEVYQFSVECLEDRPIWDDDLLGRLIR